MPLRANKNRMPRALRVPIECVEFYFVEVRIPINRLDLLAKQGLIRGFTRVVLEAEGSDNTPANARRVWVTINELKAEDSEIGRWRFQNAL